MRKLVFFNNAAFALAEALPNTGAFQNVLPDRSLAAANLDMGDAINGDYTVATITNSSLPDTREVVFIHGIVDVLGTAHYLVERGQEGTALVAWPIGSVVECRVTQGMLLSLGSGATYSHDAESISINNGDIAADIDASGNVAPLRTTWAIGGMPVSPARGFGEDTSMSASVEGVGYSSVIELGVAPDYNPATAYYPGDYVKDTSSPFYTWSLARGAAFPASAHTLGLFPWVRYAPENDSNIVSTQRTLEPDIWFYPTEIGFICENRTSSNVPSVVVKELDITGTPVGNLVTSVALTNASTRNRVVLSTTITKGVKGLQFVRSLGATGGSCRGRFYWRGYFISSNTAGGYPANVGSTDGQGSMY